LCDAELERAVAAKALALADAIGLTGGLAGAYLHSLFAASSSVGDGSFVGWYVWRGRADVELRPDGTFLRNRARIGNYYRTSPFNIVLINYDGQSVDFLTADAAYRQLRGISSHGDTVTAKRR